MNSMVDLSMAKCGCSPEGRFFGWINLIKAPARWELFLPSTHPGQAVPSTQHESAESIWSAPIQVRRDSGMEHSFKETLNWKEAHILLYHYCLPIVVTWKMFFFTWCLVIAANTIGHKKRSKFGVHDLTHALHGVRPCRRRTCGAYIARRCWESTHFGVGPTWKQLTISVCPLMSIGSLQKYWPSVFSFWCICMTWLTWVCLEWFTSNLCIHWLCTGRPNQASCSFLLGMLCFSSSLNPQNLPCSVLWIRTNSFIFILSSVSVHTMYTIMFNNAYM